MDQSTSLFIPALPLRLDLTGMADGISRIRLQPGPPLPQEKQPPEPVPPDLLKPFIQLQEYFQGKRRTFSVHLNLNGTPFQLRVWQEARRIPYGETRSYKELATAIGNPAAARAVGQALHRNPVPIIVPCHRIIGRSGRLTGFAAGLNIKRYLLGLEQRYSEGK